MRRLLSIAAVFFCCAGLARAQVSYVSVSATITDPNGHPYANAGYTFSLVNSVGNPVSSATTPNGQIYNAKPVTGILDATGSFTTQIVPNTILVNPPNTAWAISITFPADRQILTNYPPWQLNYTTAITGTVDLSTQLSAIANAIQFINLRTGQNTLEAPSAVSQIIAGANCTVTPSSGIGIVTINCIGGVTSFNGRTGAIVPQAGDYTASQVTNAADLTAANVFTNLGAQQFNGGANFFGVGSNVIENFWQFSGSTTEIHLNSTFDIFKPFGTATSSANFNSMFGPRMQASYWQGASSATGEASPFVTCGVGTNPLCSYSLHWIPDVNVPEVGAATFAESFPGPLTVTGGYADTSGAASAGDCVLVNSSGKYIYAPCAAGGTNATQIQGVPVSATTPTNGYVLGFNGTNWLPVSPSVASGTVATTPGAGVSQLVTQLTGTTLAVNNLNNYYLAAQYQTGGGNNGIANVAALNSGSGLTGIADPGYASTETIANALQGAYGNGSLAGTQPNWPTNTDILDDRGGLRHQVFTVGGTLTAEPVQWGEYYFNDYHVTGSINALQNAMFSSTFNGIGQQISGFGGINLKSYWTGFTTNYYSAAAGQHLGRTHNMLVEGVGDVVMKTEHSIVDGGASTFNDVGSQLNDNIVAADQVIPTGTITSSPGTYALQVNLGATVGHEGDNRYLIDKTTGVISGSGYPTQYFENNAAFPPSQVTPWGQNGQIPPDAAFVGTSFTPSTMVMICTTAFGGSCPNTSSTNPSGQIQSASGGYAPGTLTVQVITSAPGLPTGFQTSTSGFSAGDVVCVADSQYFESTTIASVVDGTHLSVNFRKPHFNGAVLSKGGTPGCQYGFENTGQTFQYNGTGQKYMQVWPVVGALTSTDLLIWDHNPQQNWSKALTGNNSSGYCATDPITITSVSTVGGTSTVTFVDTRSGGAVNANFIGSNVTVATVNATYNGSFSITPVAITFGGQVSYPAYQYTVSAVSGTQPATGTASLCNQNYNFYPMVEVTDVRNPSTNSIDGYFQLAPYNLAGAFATSDTVAEPHYFWQYINESTDGDGVYQQLPQPAYVGVHTAGINYGDSVAGNKVGFDIDNVSAQNLYAGYGGTLASPQSAYQVEGAWNTLLYGKTPPNSAGFSSGAVIYIPNCKPAPIGCNNAAYSPFAIYRGPESPDVIYDNTFTDSIDFGGAIGLNGPGAFTMRMYSPVFGTIAASQDQSSSLTPDGIWQGTFSDPAVSTGCAQWSVSGTLTSTGGPCASGGISGGAPGFLPTFSSATTISAPSHIDDGVTTPLTLTATEPFNLATGTAGGTVNATEGTPISAVAGHDILYADSTSHCIKYSANGGAFNCINSGSSIPTATAAGQVPISTGAGTTYTAGTSVPTFSITALTASSIGATTPGSGAFTTLSATSGITSISDGVHAGYNSLVGNTTAPAVVANSAGFMGPNSASFTGYALQLPSTNPAANQLIGVGAPVSGVAPVSYVSPTALTTNAQCLAATSVTTPCVALNVTYTGLGTSAGTTSTLYTSNAPVNSLFSVCFMTQVDTLGVGTAIIEFTGTTPGGHVNTSQWLYQSNISLTAVGFVQNCSPVSLASGSSFTIQPNVSAASGSPVWETAITVMRLN